MGAESIRKYMSLAICSITSFARDIQLDEGDSDNEVLVTISASVPEGFDLRVEVYLNDSLHPLTKNYQFTMELPLDKNTVYDVVVLSSTDVEDRYEFVSPTTLSPSTENYLTIQVNELFEEPREENNDSGKDGITEITDFDLAPLQYDFSNGQESGIIHISMKDYGVFDTVTYRLVVEKEVYDIILDSEHNFQADVILTEGSYKELESAFPELTETIRGTETIPSAQEVEEEPFDLTNLLFVIEGVLCGFGIGLAIFHFTRKRRK